MADLLSDLNRETLADAIGVAALAVTMITVLWLPALLGA